MGRRDPRVDAYIARQAPFARPILTRLRATIHAACPGAEETLKWGMPSFMHHGILCGIAGFKHHCALWFRQPGIEALDGRAGEAMGQFGRLTTLAALPPRDVIVRYVRRAMVLNERKAGPAARGAKTPRRPARAKPAGRPAGKPAR
jgi:hypothetical protein